MNYLSDFTPTAVMFAPHHYWQVIWSDIGVILWLAGVATAIYTYGFANVFTVYLVPYLW